jgi:hypothetical protein
LPQLCLGIAFGFGVPMAFAAVTNTLPWECWALFAASVCYGFAYDTEYAMVDRDDDLKIGIRTSAITLGRYDVAAVMASYALMVALLAWVGIALDLRWPYYAGLAAAAGMMAYHYRLIRDRSREGCFRAFKHNNNWVGLAAFAGIALPTSSTPAVSIDQQLAGYDIASGVARRALHAVRQPPGAGWRRRAETIPLAHLASVRVAFERDARKLNWAIGLLALALVFAVVSGPLQAWMMDLSAKVGASAGRESLEAVLVAAFGAFAKLARLLFPLALVLAAGATALLVFFWLGQTTLTLAFAATERVCAVRGRDPQLADFADLLGERLATRKD